MQQSGGKLTVRERVDALVDPGSLRGFGQLGGVASELTQRLMCGRGRRAFAKFARVAARTAGLSPFAER